MSEKYLHSPPAGWGAKGELYWHLPVSKKGLKETQDSVWLSPTPKHSIIKVKKF